MQRFLIIGLWWLSSVFLSGCVSTSKMKWMDGFTNCPAIYRPAVTDANYRAQIDFGKRHFSGLVLFKIIDEKCHVFFLTETGMKFFDFEYGNGNIKTAYILPALDKRPIVNLLQRSFEPLVVSPIENQKRQEIRTEKAVSFLFPEFKPARRYTAIEKCEKLTEIVESGKRSYFLSYGNSTAPQHISFHQKQFHLQFDLSRMEDATP
ncbi:MAG: hypothetical protein U0T73_01630 [Chitinophagales bacterium]